MLKLFTVNFGTGKSGLSTVGYTLKDHDRSLTGVQELRVGTGIYGVTLSSPLTPSYLLWDTGDSSPVYAIEDINLLLAPELFKTVNFGTGKAHLSTVGVTVGSTRTVTPEIVSGTGIYGGMITPPDRFQGQIIWDTGETSGRILYALDDLNLKYELISYFELSSFSLERIANQVGLLQLRGI